MSIESFTLLVDPIGSHVQKKKKKANFLAFTVAGELSFIACQ
jgi:hypothetical protein